MNTLRITAAYRLVRPLSTLTHPSASKLVFTRAGLLPRQSICCHILQLGVGAAAPRRLFSGKPETTEGHTQAASTTQEEPEYVGPLTTTFRKLKLFSMASFGLSMTLAPFMFIVESNLPYTARFALASIAIGTSGLSTSLVAWCGRPYVTTLRRHKPDGVKGGEVLELTTTSLFLRPRITTVYDPEFLIETRRPMAKWELAQQMALPASRLATEGKELVGKQETVAETVDHTGKVIGRWIVTWGENGEGVCHEAGTVIRYFNVHEELLH